MLALVVSAGSSVLSADEPQQGRVLSSSKDERDPSPAPSPSPSPDPSPSASPPPESRESPDAFLRLILHVHRPTGTISLVSHSRISDPPPKHRAPVEPGEWLVTAQTVEGDVVWERPIPDPTVVYAETVDPVSGAISGERLVRDEADFPLVIPAEPAADHLSFYEPTSSGLDLIGTYELEGAS